MVRTVGMRGRGERVFFLSLFPFQPNYTTKCQDRHCFFSFFLCFFFVTTAWPATVVQTFQRAT